ESDPRRRLLQFDVQQFCDNFVKGVDKALKDVSKSQKKSTSTRAPVAEPSFSISKKTQGESENCFEEFKDFQILHPYLMKLMKNQLKVNVELTVLQPEHPSSLVLSQQVFEEEPLDIPHQCPCLDTWISLDEVPEPIFDVEDEPDPVFDEEATSIIYTFMESHLCFDSGTTIVPSSPAPLLPDLQEHCEKSELVISLSDMFDKISSLDVIRFGLGKIKENCFSKSVFGNMINSFKIFEPDKFLDQQRFQTDLGISSEIILSFDQSLEQSKVFDHFEKYLELDLKQTDFCATKSFDSFVFKENSFGLNSSRHRLITDDLFASSLDLDDFLIKKMQEQSSFETETGFCELDFCDSVLQPDLLSFETDKTWHFLRSFRDNGVVLSSDEILVYNTFFEKCLELLINDSQTELKLVCSDVGKDMPILKMNIVVAYLDKILERQVQPLIIESIDRAQQPEFWRSFVETGYLDASDRGSVQERYRNSTKVFCLEYNFKRKPTHQGFTEAWNRMKIFTDEEVMNFPNRRFFSPSIREYQISKGDSCPIKNRPEPKPILHEPKLTCLMLAHVLDDYPKGLDPDLDVLKIEKPFDYFFGRFDVTDRTLYWTVPHAFGWELWLEPWPDDRFHCTGLYLHRPVFHLMKNSLDGIAFGHTNPELGHCYTFLDSTACTARMCVLELQHYPRPDDGIHQTEAWLYRTVWYSKTNDRARIRNGQFFSSPSQLNFVLYVLPSNGQDRFGFGRVELKIGRDTLKLATLDCPACVLAQSVGQASGYNEPGWNLKGFSPVKVQRDREKDKEKELAPGERTPKGTLNQGPGRFSIQVLGLWPDCSWSDLDVLDRTWTVVRERHREVSGHGKMCGEWVIVDRCEILIAYCATCELMLDQGTKRTKSRKGKESAGGSGPVIGDGANPTQVLPTQTGLVNEETGEPLAMFLPTEVQVDNLGEQQEEVREEEGDSSHAGDETGPGDGVEELAEPSMHEVMDVVKAMGTKMLALTPAKATVQATHRAARTAGTAAGVARAAA
ncbi:hypothetical protein IGI04_042387, partial [Brassica rapa subsp. trilocularis]